jgi:NAD(P) transhydrogenase
MTAPQQSNARKSGGQPDHFDLIVIGAGPAGEKGAAQAAYFGKRVCVIERAPKPGGAAVNTGTIPSKTLRETALYFSGLRQRGLYGVEYTVKRDITIADFMYRERAVVETEWELISSNLERHHVTTLQGAARFVAPHTIEVSRYREDNRRITGEVILIATGSVPLRPDIFPFDEEVVLDSDSILRLPQIPRRMVVVGGGVIGCEYACIFAALGVRVTLVNSRDRLLAQLDSEVSDTLRNEMTRRLGIVVSDASDVASITVDRADHGGLAQVVLTTGTVITAECVLCSVGRSGATADLGLDVAGVKTNSRGYIVVDESYQTSVPHIYAAGDVIGFPALASTSMEQARVAMCHGFELKYKQRVSPVLPYAVYTIPEVAMVGETEETCRQKGLNYEVGRSSFRLNPRGQIIGETDGFVKLIFRPEDQRLIGASVVGEGASELVHLPMACMMFDGTIDFFIQGVFNYPTLGDAFKYAAYDGLQRMAKRAGRSPGLPSAGLKPDAAP